MNRTTLRRAGTPALTAAAMLTLLAAPMSSAFAAPANDANIDFDRNGSIIVHKYANPAWEDAANDGSAQSAPESATPLQGVTFSYQKIALDLKKTADWEKVSNNLRFEDGAVKYGESDTVELEGSAQNGTPTNEQGMTTFSNLKPGAYLIKEVDKGTTAQIINSSDPFIVVIPQKNATGNTWNYDVNVYPKSAVFESAPTMEVDKTNAIVAGEQGAPDRNKLGYTVKAKMPEDTDLTKVEIIDPLNKYLDGENAEVTSVTAGETTLDPADYEVTKEAGQLKVVLKGDGLTKAKGKEVTVKFTTPVKATTEFGEVIGEIKNKANVTINDSEPVDTNETVSNWGKVSVGSPDAAEGDKIPAGTKFDVFPKDDPDGEPIATITVGEDGTGWVDVPEGDYVVKQKADDTQPGYTTDPNPKPVHVDPGSNAEVPFTPTKNDLPGLPLTGSDGQQLMMLGGVSALALAAGLTVVARKRKAERN